MPRERESITHKFRIGMQEGYITAGKYEDGSVGEIFLTDIGKEGSTIKGLMNAFATAISIGPPVRRAARGLRQKFSYMRFEPEGITRNPEIPFAKSMPDYIMRWLASRFIDDIDYLESLGILTDEVRARKEAQQAFPMDDTGSPATARTATRTARATATAPPRPSQRRVEAGDSGAHRHAAGRPGEDGSRPRARPGLRPVRRHDAAHGLLLHVLELRQQHRLRLAVERHRKVPRCGRFMPQVPN